MEQSKHHQVMRLWNEGDLEELKKITSQKGGLNAVKNALSSPETFYNQCCVRGRRLDMIKWITELNPQILEDTSLLHQIFPRLLKIKKQNNCYHAEILQWLLSAKPNYYYERTPQRFIELLKSNDVKLPDWLIGDDVSPIIPSPCPLSDDKLAQERAKIQQAYQKLREMKAELDAEKAEWEKEKQDKARITVEEDNDSEFDLDEFLKG